MYNYREEEQQYEMNIENRMYQCKQDSLDALAGIVHPDYLNNMVYALAYSFIQEDAHAQSIANDLNLDYLNFYAVVGDINAFRDELWEQEEKDYINNMRFEEEAYELTI